MVRRKFFIVFCLVGHFLSLSSSTELSAKEKCIQHCKSEVYKCIGYGFYTPFALIYCGIWGLVCDKDCNQL
ncbi:hypothetical protein CRM22_005192 [Opisthorchis felineus]|uniref:Uncharacterized protein n=1 Tax=Opisthorchis felineus TaxID=147828 RepID=A0A4S2LSB2_OPIFE|nr:hypothetical protein CRM22_005192 [Opisthorchis felineus]TGZ66663.1 hypothetical protein CRM22_005192 [Opisthorchis felineus]